MIRIGPTTSAELDALVDAENSTWRTRATTRTDAMIAAGAYDENASIWAQVKPVFMKLQYYKCVFCERALGGAEAGSGEHDLEHFRPKNPVKVWPSARKRRELGYTFGTGAPSTIGYYWLAYDLANYSASCRSCNSALKSNYFPILGSRGTSPATVSALNITEQPLLLYPVGPHGDDPTQFLSFRGITIVPLNPAGVAWQRAQVTIDFFRLNTRAELRRGRFEVIRSVYSSSCLAALSTDAAQVARAKRTLTALTSSESPHSACAEAYLALMVSDPDLATEMYDLAELALTR